MHIKNSGLGFAYDIGNFRKRMLVKIMHGNYLLISDWQFVDELCHTLGKCRTVEINGFITYDPSIILTQFSKFDYRAGHQIQCHSQEGLNILSVAPVAQN